MALAVGVAPATAAAAAPESPPQLLLVRVAKLADVTAMAARPGTRTLYVTEHSGVVRALRDGKVLDDPVVDISSTVSPNGGEQGLLGIAFSPDGRWMYLDSTDRNGDTQIDQFAMAGRNADASSRRRILKIDQPQPNHNGGQLAFGPDGNLYIGMGDGGAGGDQGDGHARGGNGQSLGTLLGKILRIAPVTDEASTAPGSEPYTVPADNPFVDQAGARPEIWSYGLRNPWRFSFDKDTGDLWIGDVGQDAYEEIDAAPATDGRNAGKGLNFGWNVREGAHGFRDGSTSGLTEPVYEIAHDTGACAVIGGFVYRGTRILALADTYLFADGCDGTIRALTGDPTGKLTMLDTGAQGEAISSFGQANDGTLYVLSLSDGIFRVAAR
ncbi:MAG: PQQ-dependent sugar dehydrogenase [Acidimicrobiia bacterium]